MLSFQIGEEEGLPKGQITAGLEGSRGFIWMFRSNGTLARFDGQVVTVYNEQNGLPENIQQFAEAPDSTIWLISNLLGELEKSIYVFDPIREKAVALQDFLTQSLPFQAKDIDLVQQNGDGTIWVKTFDSKIYEYDGDSLFLWADYAPHRFFELHKVNNSLFYGWYEEPESHIAYMHRSGTVEKTHSLPVTADIFFLEAAIKNHSDMQAVYVRTGGPYSGFSSLYRLLPDAPPLKVDSTLDVGIRSYWSEGGFLYKLSLTELEQYDANFQLLNRFKLPVQGSPIFIDNDGGLWLTNQSGTISRIFRSKNYFKQQQHAIRDKIWFTAVRGITTGIADDLFMTQGGILVNISKEGEVRHLFNPNREEGHPDYFGILVQRDKKAIWLADGNKVWNINPETGEHRFFIQGATSGLFWQPYEDKTGRILLGSSQGLFFINQEDSSIQSFESHADFPALQGASIFAFHENEKGLWLCSSKGLFLLNDNYEVLAHYHSQGKKQHSLPYDIISHLHEDEAGGFWLATKGGGLVYWHPKTEKYAQYTTEEDLVDNTLYAVYPDAFGQLWLPSNKGLMCFNKKRKETIYYLENEGLPNLEFNTISHFMAADGTLFFGGVDGAIQFHPKDLMQSRELPPLVLAGFKKQNREDELYVNGIETLLQTQTIHLTAEDKFFEVSFALLDYHNPKQHRYKYKVEGYDKTWQELDNPIIRINSLPYGSYNLRFKAQAPGSAWQEFAFPITIEVPRPFYLQGWFIALILLLVVAITAAIIRWRFSALKKRKEELEELVEERTTEIAQQAEELKSLDRLKSRFFANISHELRTPLTLILGYTEEIKSKPYGMFEESSVRKKLGVIDKNGQNLLTLIEEILELSKLEANKVEINETAILLKPFIRNIFSSFESFADFNEVSYRLDYTIPESLVVYWDVQKVEKIINNLLSNAFKFTPAGAEIHLRVRADAFWLYVEVEDGGVGIHEKDIQHVFDRFYQAKYSKSSVLGGTGIGLALCKEFAELLGGEIEVRSELQKGSTFSIKLPKKEVPEDITEEILILSSKAKRQEKESTTNNWVATNKSKTILCVEDNQDMQQFIQTLLQTDYHVITANNGLDGLAALREHAQKIDLVISDAMMPLMDGFSMMTQIKGNRDLRDIPIIMLTARAAEEDKLKALTIGVDDYLIKPFSREELLIRTQNLLQNYEKRKLWKQDLMKAAQEVYQQSAVSRGEAASDNQKEQEEASISEQDLLWMKEVEEEIEKTLDNEDFKIELLAKKMLLSKRQFERKIKKITGLSPAKLLLEVKMQVAREHLEKATYDSPSAVSYAVGFKTTSYFTKRYYERFGKKPADYFR